MNLDNLNELPDWDDDDIKGLTGEEEDEEWKPNPTRDACKAMYTKWNEIVIMINGAIGDLDDEDEPGQHSASFIATQKSLVFGDAFEVGAKIRSSEAGNSYVLRMENAAIIRKNAQYIKTAMLGFTMDDSLQEDYADAIRDEIDKFKDLFKIWVGTFKKDEYEDEWGLFV